MGAFVPVAVVSVFWAIIGIVCPFFVRGENKQVIQVCLILTAVCCWLFWICTYLHQLNPLIGPEMKAEQFLTILKSWGGQK